MVVLVLFLAGFGGLVSLYSVQREREQGEPGEHLLPNTSIITSWQKARKGSRPNQEREGAEQAARSRGWWRRRSSDRQANGSRSGARAERRPTA
jgi:hypothetical protein